MKNVVKRGGVYYLAAQVDGRRYFRSLRTSDQREARARARDLRTALGAERWRSLRRLVGGRDDAPAATLGAVADAYEVLAREMGRPRAATVVEHVRCLMRLARTGGAADPRAVRCDALTPDLSREFSRGMLAGRDGADLASGRRSVVAAIRHAHAIFRPAALARMRETLQIPDVSAWLAEMPTVAPRRPYVAPAADQVAGLEDASRVVGGSIRLVWILGYEIGLRSSEMIAARWTWAESRDGMMWLRVVDRPDEAWECKGADGWTPIPAAVWEELLTYRRDGDPYMVPGGSDVRARGAHLDSAATVLIQREFAGWMRAQGWTRGKCAHELREFRGDWWMRRYGRDARSYWLRHARQSVGDWHYSDRYFAPWLPGPGPVAWT